MNRRITKWDVARYILLPQIGPRIRAVFGTGFAFIPYFIALVFQCVRLLPSNHVYLNPANIGRFGIRHVVAETSKRLVFNFRHVDQVLLFFMVIAGIVLMMLQIFIIGLGVFISPVLADMPTNFSGFFVVPADSRPHDLSLMMMDLVFGVDMFGSCISTGGACVDMHGDPLTSTVGGATVFGTYTWPYPIHTALHQLFTVYSLGLLVVAVFICLYFMVTVVAETAQTGTPFGKRFSKVWAPIRIVVAFGLLVPLTSGLNGSQYAVLYAAKFGSGFASNGWRIFNETLNAEHFGHVEKLVASPNVPEVGTLLQFMFVARTCYETDRIIRGDFRANNPETRAGASPYITPYLVKDPFTAPTLITQGMTYDQFLQILDGDNMALIRFGIRSAKQFPLHKGNVAPVCGEITYSLTDVRRDGAEAGVRELQEHYFTMIKDLWYGNGVPAGQPNYPDHYAANALPLDPRSGLQEMPAETATQLKAQVKTQLEERLRSAVEAQENAGRWDLDENLRSRGWAGAAIWYNRIAEMNGAVTSALFKVPMPSKYPETMEYVKEKKMQYDQNVDPLEQFYPKLAYNEIVPFGNPIKHKEALALYNAFKAWGGDNVAATTHTSASGNMMIDMINALFGTEGLYNMRANADVHPLAQLSSLGKSLVDSSINNLGYALFGGIGGSLTNTFAKFGGKTGSIVANFFITFAMIGLTIGFILFYIVPFLPFIYFFFAFIGWVKEIFEAMVGAPLWALAHIRIDGDGLPGQAAQAGYFLLLAIFLRPILIVTGFLASIIIFSGMVQVLNEIFTIATANVSGFDVGAENLKATPSEIAYYRAPVDEFFFTIMYAVVVYMLGMSSFKLIDDIPGNILRWMGQSVTPFSDGRQDPAGNLLQFAQVGANQGLQQLEGGMKGLINYGTKPG